MAAFKVPSFQDRATLAAQAKQKALDHLKAKPPVDEGLAAERRNAWDVQQAKLSAERLALAQARNAAKAEKAAAKAAKLAADEEAAALKAARLAPPTPAEMKAARDARYAARQERK